MYKYVYDLSRRTQKFQIWRGICFTFFLVCLDNTFDTYIYKVFKLSQSIFAYIIQFSLNSLSEHEFAIVDRSTPNLYIYKNIKHRSKRKEKRKKKIIQIFRKYQGRTTTTSSIMTFKLLVINPNSSESVTANLKPVLPKANDVVWEFYTAPPAAPREITGKQTSIESEQIVLEDIKQKELYKTYDGFIVGCYSSHPLITSLSKLARKPVMGIMQATLVYALANPQVTKLFILTSTTEWEPLLDEGILDFVGASEFPSRKFLKTRGLDVSVTSLANEEEYSKIRDRLCSILASDESYKDVDCILLGCAGLAGLDAKLAADFPHIRFVDSVKVAGTMLHSLVQYESQ